MGMNRGAVRGKQLHFVGIGGVGMSAVAQVALQRGALVSGSDIRPNSFTQRLERAGAKISFFHAPTHVGDADAVIYSTCIDCENPEITLARQRNIPVLHRAELLADLLRGKKTISVTGAHGKTTVSAWLAHLLRQADFDPGFAVGAETVDLDGNAADGSGPWFVLEADESDGSFLRFTPEVAVLTNIDREHLDYYGDVEAIVRAYAAFARQVNTGGTIVYWQADTYLPRALRGTAAAHLSYALRDPAADLWADDIHTQNNISTFACYFRGRLLSRLTTQLPGQHNVLNALAVVGAALTLDVPLPAIQTGIATFRGARRRFEIVCRHNGIILVDDYGHHPTEIRATLAAAKSWQARRVVCVFQPHRYSRTKLLQEEFGQCFFDADVLVITDLYSAFERPVPGVNAQSLVAQATGAGHPNVHYVPRPDVQAFVRQTVREGDIVVFCGAGDIGGDAPLVGRSLEAALCPAE